MAEVAVLGTGRMGSAMARRLAAAGHGVRLWNRTPQTAAALAAELGGRSAATPAEAVAGCDVVLSVLADGDITSAVLLDPDVVAATGETTVVVDHATSGVAAARHVAAGLAAHGTAFVDAPVSGSVPTVMAGQLLVMASGAQADIDTAGPVLDSYAKAVVRVGDAGAGQVMKLAVNLVVHTLAAAVGESLVLAGRGGIAAGAAYDVLAASVVGAPFVQYKREAYVSELSGAAAPVAMSVALTAKDLRLIGELAGTLGLDLPVTAAVGAAYGGALEAGLGDADMAALVRRLRDEATAWSRRPGSGVETTT